MTERGAGFRRSLIRGQLLLGLVAVGLLGGAAWLHQVQQDVLDRQYRLAEDRGRVLETLNLVLERTPSRIVSPLPATAVPEATRAVDGYLLMLTDPRLRVRTRDLETARAAALDALRREAARFGAEQVQLGMHHERLNVWSFVLIGGGVLLNGLGVLLHLGLLKRAARVGEQAERTLTETDSTLHDRTSQLVRANVSKAQLARENEFIRELHKRTEERAIRDGNTGLLRHDMMLPMLTERILGLPENSNLVVAKLDVDKMKAMNDELFGHAGTDRMLALIGQEIQNVLRRTTDLSFRSGGDEFTCVFEPTTPDDIRALPELIRAGIANLRESYTRHETDPPRTVTLWGTVSVGVTTIGEIEEWRDFARLSVHERAQRMETLENLKIKLLAKADARAYISKHEGRNRVTFEG